MTISISIAMNAEDQQRLRAERDHLTGLFNRSAFERLARTDQGGGTLMICDIDHFKRINDRFGYQAADAVICAFAGLLRSRGQAARVGGEEFAVWMPGVDLAEARAHAENLRLEFACLNVPELAEDMTLTASFGLAAFGPHTPLRLVSAQADAALYCAKSSGRNCVIAHGYEAEEEAEPQAPTGSVPIPAWRLSA